MVFAKNLGFGVGFGYRNNTTVLWGNMTYCVKVSGEDLLHYSNKTESVDSRKCLYITAILRKRQ